MVPTLRARRYTQVSGRHRHPTGIHVRLSCLTPFGLMQIRSRRICAGIQATWRTQLAAMALRTRLGNRQAVFHH